MPTLLLLLSEDLDVLTRKGEVLPNYYNPDGCFSRVVVLAARGDQLPTIAYQMFGSAAVEFYRIDTPPVTQGWQAIRKWWAAISRLASESSPNVVRTYSSGWIRLVACRLSARLRVPYLCSTHEPPDAMRRQRARTYSVFSRRGIAVRLHGWFSSTIDWICIPRASAHICVYDSAARYVRRRAGRNVHVIYNSVSRRIRPKSQYELNNPPLIVTVGQQTRGLKEPSAIILAMEHVDGILEVIGDGDFHEDLVAMANANPAIRDRVRFRKYMPNEEVMKRLYEADIVAYRTYYAEFSKIMMESMLAGAPIVASRLSHSPVAELESNTTVCLVGDTPELWAAAFNELLGDHRKRRALGESALALARRQYNPESLEKAHADLYRRLMGTAA